MLQIALFPDPGLPRTMMLEQGGSINTDVVKDVIGGVVYDILDG